MTTGQIIWSGVAVFYLTSAGLASYLLDDDEIDEYKPDIISKEFAKIILVFTPFINCSVVYMELKERILFIYATLLIKYMKWKYKIKD